MHGDFSRDTFDPEAGYRSVLLQQGRVLLDADWNEQGAITARHDEVRTRDVVGPAGGPADGAAFAVTDDAGAAPEGTAWEDLRLSPGRFYVDGVLAEVAEDPDHASVGPALADQPFLPQVADVPELAGLPEPSDDGRYAAVLDVWTRHVTPDEAPGLLESALGGPDTTTRAQTAWQVRLTPVDPGDACASLAGAAWLTRTPPTMTASLAEPDPGSDPCEITASEGYRRLENQLYRVQVSSVDSSGDAEVVWSRENGSVVAGLVEIATVTGPDADAELTLDREGRDDELSFRSGDVVEVTSRDRELAGLPALLAIAGVPDGLVLPVTWLGSAAADPGAQDVANLGATPIVRRWEGGPLPADTAQHELEDGVQVTFGSAGEFRVGDYWLVPARTVRLVYGVSALGGTIEWPQEGGVALPQPPRGPVRHSTIVAVLERSGGGTGTWSLVSDCRRLTPALTDLVTVDLLGGDGQEALPGVALDEPVRVVVRNGGLPEVGARVRFDAPDGHLDLLGAPTSSDPASLTATTDADGHADVRWLLGTAGPVTQVLTAVRLDDADTAVGAQVRATARRSQADQVAWEPSCEGFAGTDTVQEALAQLAATADLRLLGGDGQQVLKPGTTVPHRVRVVLDSPCGPVGDSTVVATATQGGLVAPAAAGQQRPATLSGTAASREAGATTDDDGVAAFWWQPDLAQRPSDVLSVVAKAAPAAPIVVSAHRAVVGQGTGRTGGLHITRLTYGSNEQFANDDDVKVEQLLTGIMAVLDAPALGTSVRGKPVVRVTLDLPWPVDSDGADWNDATPFGTRRVELAGEANADGALIVWNPQESSRTWLRDRFRGRLEDIADVSSVLARFEIDGWAIVSEQNPQQHLNGHARTEVDAGGRTRLVLPTDDEVTGGQFVQWFRLE